jgi:hypothetical protein
MSIRLGFHSRDGMSVPEAAKRARTTFTGLLHPEREAVADLRVGKGGWGTGKAEEQPHALRNYLTTRLPDGALMLLNCYLSFPSSAKVARDCLINSANSRL